jgi:histidinol-phosphatase
MFSTQIALMRRGELIVGVSSASEYGELAYAEKGRGAWLDGKPISVSKLDRVENATLSIGNVKSMTRGSRWGRLGALIGRLDRIRGYGDFLHYHLLAAGKIDAVIESDVNILDIAALAAIVEEAGGRFTDLEGGPVTLTTSSVLATNGRLHRPILEALGG